MVCRVPFPSSCPLSFLQPPASSSALRLQGFLGCCLCAGAAETHSLSLSLSCSPSLLNDIFARYRTHSWQFFFIFQSEELSFFFTFSKFKYDVSLNRFLWLYLTWDSLIFRFVLLCFSPNLGSSQPLFLWMLFQPCSFSSPPGHSNGMNVRS